MRRPTPGHEVLVANPRKVRAIYDNDKKSDRVDGEQLARFARMDPMLLSPITHRGMATRADLAVLRSRSALVDSRTQLVDHVRGSVKPFGVRFPASSTPTFARKAAWKIPRELRPALVPILRTIAQLTARIVKFECRIEQLAYHPVLASLTARPRDRLIDCSARLDGLQHAPDLNRSFRVRMEARRTMSLLRGQGRRNAA